MSATKVLALSSTSVLFFSSLLAQTSQPTSQPTDIPFWQVGYKVRVIGRLNQPLGKGVTVEGKIILLRGKSDETCFQVFRINGLATQEYILSPIEVRAVDLKSQITNATELVVGQCYQFKEYERGGFIGDTPAQLEEMDFPIQTRGYYFSVEFVAQRGRQIDCSPLIPADFLNREALFQGKAVSQRNQSWIQGPNWRILINDKKPWPASDESKLVEACGIIRPTKQPNEFSMENCQPRLVKLEDQVGREVCLRGIAKSMNGDWWLTYRDKDLYVENMDKLPSWSAECHWEPVEIKGRLEQTDLPDIEMLTKVEHPPKKQYFIVRNPTWRPINDLLTPEQPAD